ncbi:uncharacterized protein DFL_008816 [Arthrobotrys flagrans]|uniref:Peptidase S59 domain-containing protein n=1 Tax=Arthrobotrys flagrans TaxID=97331 RepID=A0A436ZQ80_ARTFL|nr:hypothetical protein DFL_008816 [Arthrobotrys flagrans]
MFSGGSGFGGGFGQNQQQQQQPSGGFGANTTGTGFGGFGQTTQNQSAGFGSTGFGANTQSAGFGSTGFGNTAAGGFGQNKGFGATPTTTGGGLFGSNTATSGFGAGATSGGGFGTGTTGGFGGNTTGGGIFGGSTTGNTGGGFGAAQNTGGGFGAAAAGSSNLQPPAQGTATSPFSPFTEKDAASSMTNHFQTISFTDPYKNWSLEELRLQDYMQNRTKAAGPSGFGSGGTGFGAFGQQQQQTTTGGFGQPQTTSATGGGLFGTASNTTNTGFGAGAAGGFGSANTNTGGLFGQPKPAGAGIFGSSNTTSGTGATGGGLFGAQNNTTGTGFGNAGTTGGFGQAAPSTGTGLFGTQNQQKPAGFGTGFGTTGTGGFGQPASGNTLFGQQQQPATSTATGTGGLFGTTQQSTGGFGQQTTGAFGSGGFGAQNAQQQQQPAATGFGAFGQAAAQTPAKPAFGGFGTASTTPAPAATGGGLFGQTQQAQQPTAAGGLFGNNKPFGATTTPAAGGLFGQQQQAQQPAQTGGLFGQQPAATGTSGGLFGQPQQTAQTGGLFGNQQKPGGLFGQPAQPAAAGGGLFGSAAAAQPQGSSLFGQPAQNAGAGFGQSSAGGLFGGAAQPAQQGFGASLFQSQQLQQQQPQMPQVFTASIMDQRPYGNVSLLDASLAASTAPGLLATPLSGAKKKAAMIPHSKIAPRQPALTPRVASPFSRSSLGTSSPMAGGSLGRTFSGSSSRIGLGGSVFDSAGTSDDSILNTSAFTPGGNRSTSLKRLVIDRNLRDSDLFVKEGEVKAIKAAPDSTATPDNTIKKTVSFDASPRSQAGSPASGADLGYMRTPTRHSSAPISSPAPENALVRVPSPEPEVEVAEVEVEQEAGTSTAKGSGDKTGDYWSIPSVDKLKSMPREKLSAVPDLLVGRNNFGQIRFDQPVDLTAFADALEAILGGVITFADRVCTVYPPGWDKPLPGNGLNVPATITLEECFPTDREHKQPIRDPDHPRYQFHLRRLKNIKDTEFVDYLVQDGIWIFKVQHFTTYGLQEEDDETDAYMSESVYTDATPTKRFDSSVLEESSFASPSDITFEDDSIADDTFDFKRSRKAPSMRFIDETLTSDIVDPADASGESVEGSDLSEEEGETTQILPHEDVSIVGEDDDTQLAPVAEDFREATPEVKLGVGRDWTDQLSRTISPVKTRAPLGFRDPITSARNPFGDVSNVDFSESLFASRNRDFESPYRPSVRVFSSPVVNRNKKASSISQYRRPEAFDKNSQQLDDREWRQCIRPSWGLTGEIIYAGSIDGGHSRAFGEIKSSKTHKAKLQYSAEASAAAIDLLEFQLAASEILQDRSNIPFAKLDVTLGFDQFTKAKFGTSPQQQHEKAVWQLASILFDTLEDGYPPEEAEFHVRIHLRTKKRKLMLSRFFEELVAADVANDEKAASTPEASAFALLSGHKVDEAVDHLILGNDFRLATLMPLIGGDRQARDDVKKQLESWRASGVLAEIPVAIRALYELVAGNVGFSEGVNASMEDATPSFWIGEMFGLDWRRTFALRLWYEIFEDQALEQAVSEYQKAFKATDTQHVRHPKPWYYPDNKDTYVVEDEEEESVYDTLWGLLNMYADENYPLERVLSPRSYSPNPCDFRLAWQLRMMLAEKQVRDFTEDTMMLVDDGETKTSSVAAEKLTLDFASQLESEGQWHWAVFVLMHLSTPESRAFTIKEMLAKHVGDLTSNNEKQDFILHKLLIPSAWVYEAKALQARFQQDHFEEVECLLSASAWSEAHKTLLNNAAPLCIINEDLEKLYTLISKFTDSSLVENWSTGAQIYLDFIFLSSIMHHHKGFSPAIPKVKGIPKHNSRRDVAKRLMEGLPRVDIREFLPGVAVREMSRVLADYVLKSHDLGIEGGRVLGLPLTEDQVLYKELTIKAREGMVMG